MPFERIQDEGRFERVEEEQGLFYSQAKEKTLPERIMSGIGDLFRGDQQDRAARAIEALYYAEELGIKPSEAFEHSREIGKAMGGKAYPTPPELIEKLAILPITAGLMSHPLTTILGVGTFMGLAEAESYAVSQVKDEKYQVFRQRGLADLLPEDMSQVTHDVVETLDFIAKGLVTGGIFKKSPGMVEKFTKEIVTEHGLPERLYVSAKDLYAEMQTGGIVPAQEMEIIKSLGLTSAEWRQAVTKGIHIEIPTERTITISDRPWYARVKRLFKLDPAQEVVTEAGGEPTYRFGGRKHPLMSDGEFEYLQQFRKTERRQKVRAAFARPEDTAAIADMEARVMRGETTWEELDKEVWKTGYWRYEIKGETKAPDPFARELVRKPGEPPPAEPATLPAEPPSKAAAEFKQATEFRAAVGGLVAEKPRSEILTFIRKAGGINPALAQGEMERFSLKESGTTGLASKKGIPPDEMREKLAEAGYLDEGSSVSDMYDLMDVELYRAKFGEAVSDLSIAEVMEEQGALDLAIAEAERAIRKAEAAGLREGIKQERARKAALEAKKKARKESRQFIEKMARVIMRPVGASVDFYYREAIENLRAGIDPSFRAKKTLEDRERIRRFLSLHPEKLEDIPIRMLHTLNKKALNEYTMGDLEGIAVETIRLRRQGRLKKDIERAQERRQVEDEVDLITFNVLKGTEIEPSTEPITSATAREAIPRRMAAAARANTLRPSRIFDKMDGGQNFQGPTHRIFYDQVNDTENVKLRITDRRLDRGKAKLEELGLSLGDLAARREVGGQSFTVDEMIDVYVGMKNPRKATAILFGNKISQELVAQIAEALTHQERALGDWLINEYDDNYLRLREAFINYTDEDIGHEPNYTPMRRRDITYDTLRAEIADEFLHRSYLKKGYTPRGFTIARMDIPPEYQIPIYLGAWSTWLEQVPKQEQFINLGAITRHLHRIVAHKAFKAAVRQELGDEYVKAIENYVSRVANPNIYKAFDTIHRLAAMLRQNVAMAYLAYNLVTMGKQLPSVALYLADAGAAHLIGAAMEFVTHPVETITFLNERSPQLSWRHRSVERELEELRTHEKGRFEQIRKKVGRVGMMGIYAFDRLAISIGFKAVYNRAIADGFSEEEAIRLAEHSTLRTQPAAHAKDVAQIYASNEFLNWFTQFTNQLNQIYNIATHDIPTAFKKGRFYQAFLGTLSLFIAAMGIWMLTNRRIPESPEDVTEAVKDQAMNAIPIAGRTISAAESGWKGSEVPMMKGAEAVGTLAGDSSDKNKIRALLEGICVTLGLPYTGPRRFVKVLEEGDVTELVGGKPRKKKKQTKWGKKRF